VRARQQSVLSFEAATRVSTSASSPRKSGRIAAQQSDRRCPADLPGFLPQQQTLDIESLCPSAVAAMVVTIAMQKAAGYRARQGRAGLRNRRIRYVRHRPAAAPDCVNPLKIHAMPLGDRPGSTVLE